MGGLEDDEPPSKRVKASTRELKGLSNGESLKEPASCSFGASMARPLASQGDDEVIGSKGVKKVEFVRIIAEALYSLGYSKTGACLEEESGIPFHSSTVSVFIQQILDGNWDGSLASLHKIGIVDESIIKSASFIILQQKFFELLDHEKLMEALKTLRTEISPLSINSNKVRELSSFILSPTYSIVDGISGQGMVKSKPRSELLEDLQKLFPPTVMIPDRRLLQLIEQALDLQREACLFHNSSVGETSLFTDHHCGKDQIPSQTVQILQDHHDEVWYLQFSQNGKYLASSSSDNSAIIWEVDLNGKVSLKHRLIGHQKPVSCLSWSPDDDQILTCGEEEVVRRWDVSSGKCLQVYEKGLVGLISCSWSPDGKCVFSGLTDKSIIMWDLDGKEMECLKGQKTIRISDLQITSDGKLIITICKETMILLLDRESRAERCIEEDQMIVSFTLSRDNKYLLVSLVNEELHLWSIQGHVRLVAKYKGHRRSRFIVRACFGGLEQAFIASGSEDSQVYIWHRGSGELIETLGGHSGAVNCISWNPANPHMLASASDDRSIRIWGLKQLHSKRKGKEKSPSNNGIHYCNGATV
ncbi:WD repeat-containing protein 26 homolog [Cynara cardunculus var. scolymus]|uniref:CTLH, C-terminal LisH motif-containing protein n=1 Tax=Cynara cardunculus var. scolymus TaxID=59895 RepID=A0A103XS25_CYNCS|nr:WD repeat-containing protein 26 homolog [Cynara cardunculus var. scolymus]XP_024993815.1 WD repeat-containing protein 26 homolog [Cynara cardunculus var. scolymus]XP_024993816.1 WD repeat-containing protein 26 homolog [Cynara cardunculus var. scolymus]XP_024993818.1 WD repeat-containing protein 26 homolog [Cynara cardunculus var. scolymus]XP_024993819.1 WD repeat-containing protein 26 homolog [Cynara cardunculus var. scolymus]KVH95852.1 CTLH, C-terminal LisH motif-containing protein [Cynara